MSVDLQYRPEGFRRVSALLMEQTHPHLPLFLEVAARTAQEAADALGVSVGQIAKSVVFKRKLDAAGVLLVASTGFTIGGVAPVGHSSRPVLPIDRELFRFEELWAAAGHPNGVFRLSPEQLVELTAAPVQDVVQA